MMGTEGEHVVRYGFYNLYCMEKVIILPSRSGDIVVILYGKDDNNIVGER